MTDETRVDVSELRAMLANAYLAGATDVHIYWRNNPKHGAPPGDPEFGEEAAHYAASVDMSALEAQAARIEALRVALRVALRSCRRAVSHMNDAPRHNVREIVDDALKEPSL